MEKILFLFTIVFPCWIFAQNSDSALEIDMIKQTLPSYLNTNSNSAASHIKPNKTFQAFYDFINIPLVFKDDTASNTETKAMLAHLEQVSDSIGRLLETQKIKVVIRDTLYSYVYRPRKFSDLRKQPDWSWTYKDLSEEFTKNTLARMDTTISIEFIYLIKKQIENTHSNVVLNLEALSAGYYEFDTAADKCNGLNCLQADKVYHPVFNRQKTKACYLFSYKCSSGVCREFLFAERRKGKWYYVGSYPSYLLDGDE